MDQQDADLIRARAPAYWERKAGKDLFDAGFLLATGSAAGDGMTLVDAPTRQAIRHQLDVLPDALVDFADRMARRAGVETVGARSVRDRLGD